MLQNVLFVPLARNKDELTANHEYIPLLTWKFVNDKMAWGVLLLMGGGFALADGCSVSNLYNATGTRLRIGMKNIT